ncbi:hypothetical protein SAMN04489812_2505 [Microlunatus soli]|uniref:Uncharacterized protein n=1 Tax=Microlunatus soli TaxID=630515 RepID=A0A1H1TU44_9ACTN|nr:hypothetical protein SAMN04489812_2505 [Microlunatus soli]
MRMREDPSLLARLRLLRLGEQSYADELADELDDGAQLGPCPSLRTDALFTSE